jgi:hypothetical protein
MKRLLLLPLFLAAACSPEPPTGQTRVYNPAEEIFETARGEATPDDVARFLAGRPVRNGEVLSHLQQDDRYRLYSAETGRNWRVFASKRTGKQRDWSADQLRPVIGNPRVLLYPFGGPDLLHATALFPQASNYVLLGLEPAGALPYLDNQDPATVMNSIERLGRSMDSQLKHGYFITKDMKGDLMNGPLTGVTPILLASLALMDATVESVEPLSAAGRSGVDIRFRLPGGGSRRAIYVSGDLSNSGFNASYRSWLSSYGGSTSYFKAASYLMHDSGFSGIREWVLGNCRSVVQDDSGIPYRYYDSSKWDVRLHGDYQSPIPLFTKHVQPDLRAAYDAIGSGPPIPFGSGYHIRADEANLLIAVKR